MIWQSSHIWKAPIKSILKNATRLEQAPPPHPGGPLHLPLLPHPLLLPVTCESLVSREFSRIFFLFHFSISISRHFHFTFHSRSRFQGIFISLFILEMSEPDFHFTFHFSKWVKAFQISLFFSRKKSELCMSCHEKFKKMIMYNTKMQQFHNGDSLFENC